MNRRALVLGATSAIAQAIARLLAQQGNDLILAARQVERLEPFAADLRLHSNREVELVEFEAMDWAACTSLAAAAEDAAGPFQLVVLVYGYLGQQQRANADSEELLRIVNTNFTSASLTLAHLANYLERQAEPTGLIGISSVAGDRGRQSNYAYGAAKGGFALYLQGLRNRLAATGVHVMTVKPGFVDTPMTEGMDGLFLVASPERVADDILRAFRRQRDIVYVPWFWRYIMMVIKALPERLFKRLSL